MRRKNHRLVVLVALLFTQFAYAQSYNAVVNSGDLQYVTGSYEISANGSEHTTSSTCKTVGTGASVAEIFMTNWYAEPVPTINTNVNPSLIEMKLVKDSYNATTGSFCWHTISWLKQNANNDTFAYGYYFVIVLADNSNASVRAKSYTCAGTNIPSPTGTCEDDFVATSIMPTGKTYIGYGIKSFVAQTENGNGIDLNELAIDFSGGTLSGTTFTATAPPNKFMGSTGTNTAVDISAEVVFVSGTSGTTFPVGAAFQRNKSATNQSAAYNSTITYGAKPTGMDGSFAGLETIDLYLSAGTGDTVTKLNCGAFGVGDNGTNLTANIGAAYLRTTPMSTYSFNTNFFHLVTK